MPQMSQKILSVALHILVIIRHVIVIYGTHLQNNIYLGIFFIFPRFLIFWVVRGVKGKKWSKMTKHFVCHALYLRNHASYGCHLWCTCVKWWYPQVFFFFHFLKILIFLVVSGVKGQKMALNDKNVCPSHSISHEPYLIWLWFLVHICKIIVSSNFFHFFKILIFVFFRGRGRGVKGQKMTQNYYFQSFTLFFSGTVD